MSWKSEAKDDEDVMFDGITITPFEGGKVGVGRNGYCDGVEAGHVELPLLAVKPGSGRPSRSATRATRPGDVQESQNAMLSWGVHPIDWYCGLDLSPRVPAEVPEVSQVM